MVSKPCGRASKGCTQLVTAAGPKTLAVRTFCSCSCASRARVEAGWKPHASLTPEVHQKAGRIVGRMVGQRRHLEALARSVARYERLIPARVKAGMTAEQLACVRVLLGKAGADGYRRGMSCRRTREYDARQRAKAA